MSDEHDHLEDSRAAFLLRRLPGHAPGAPIRVRARVERTRRQEWAPAPRRFALFTALILATAALVADTASRLQPAVGAPVSAEPLPASATLAASVPVEMSLASTGTWATDTSIAGVELSFEGSGRVEGTSAAPRIRWDLGTLHVEVVPDRGIHLSVLTRDAEVRVIGTGFTVSRDALGTRVEVRHGKVAVECSGEPPTTLEAGAVHVCLPNTAGALIGRARALQASGAPGSEVLDTLDRGLALAGSQDAFRDELAASRVRVLLDLGRPDDALAAAQAYLADGKGIRRVDVERLAAQAAQSEGGCVQAAPWLLDLGPDAAAACSPR
jgi:hypothetical protein